MSQFNNCFPLIRISRTKVKDKPWMTKGLKVSIKHKARLYKKYLKKPTLNNKTVYKRYNNMMTNTIRAAEKHYYSKLLLEHKNSTKQLWKIYGELLHNKKKKGNHISKLMYHNKEHTDNQAIANIFNDYFSTVGTKLAKKFKQNSNYKSYLNESFNHTMYLTPVTHEEIAKELSHWQ